MSVKETVEVQKVVSAEQIQACYNVMRQLRPHLAEERSFVEQVQRQFTQGYQLACCQEAGIVRAVTGYRILEFLAWGKVLYIDDLVSDEGTRRNGYGGKLLQWVIEQGRGALCD